MTRTIVTPCAHRFRFLEEVRVVHKGRLHSSESLRHRYICNQCSLHELRMPGSIQKKGRV